MKLVFVTNNKNKVREVAALLPDNIELLDLKDIGFQEEIEESANTIEGNALIKIQHIVDRYGIDGFADDTGLEVEALDGLPGVYSARYAGHDCNADDNMDKLLNEMGTQNDRRARFKTVIALRLKNEIHTFTGICEGTITRHRQGDRGFGYDPIFMPAGFDQTFAEMDLDQKNQISHRAKALMKLIDFLKGYSAASQ